MARYLIKVGDNEYDVTVDYRQRGHKVTLNGREMIAAATELGGTRAELLVENRSYEVDVRADGGGNRRTVFMLGVEVPVEIEDYNLAKMRQRAGMSSGQEAAKVVLAPMPGLVLEAKVAPGDAVKKGDPLMVIEAMKMENVIKSPADAVVAKVAVEAGASVDKGGTLVEFE